MHQHFKFFLNIGLTIWPFEAETSSQ